MMKKPLLMLSLPNSGSTWLAEQIANTLPGCKYYDMEFFNPLRNPANEQRLVRHFGAALVSCFRNIAKADGCGIDDDIAKTWGRAQCNFNKEVFSPLKLPVFVRHFKCFVLLRKTEDTLPPRRMRIWSFYEHAWFALSEAGFALPGTTARERAMAAHGALAQAMRADAKRLGVPVVEYGELFSGRQRVVEVLEGALGSAPAALVEKVMGSRVFSPRQDDATV